MPVFPGLAAQEKYRNAFRISGLIVLVVGLVLTVIGFLAFISMFTHADDLDSGFDANFFWAFLGLPLTAVGGGLLQAGFLGAGSRYVAGETMPVLRDSASYLTNGEGILGVGRDAEPPDAEKTGPFCSACGTRNDATARFCDACGKPLTVA